MSDKIIQFDDAMFESKLDALVRIKVEQTINAMLDAEADEITNAARYERKTDRKAFRAGHYERTLTAKAGKLSLKVPKLKGALFESAVVERCRRRESGVGEARKPHCMKNSRAVMLAWTVSRSMPAASANRSTCPSNSEATPCREHEESTNSMSIYPALSTSMNPTGTF